MHGEQTHIGIEEARAKLGDLARGVAGGCPPVIFTRRGRPLAVLVSLEDFARLGDAPPKGSDT